jgi:hypothetical protein
MSKKHFIALADHIRDYNLGGDTDFTESQLNALAFFCEQQNPNFNRERWLGYIAGECGPNGGTVK